MVYTYFQSKNPNLGKFWRALEWKSLVYSLALCNILHPFGIYYSYLLNFMAFWWQFGIFPHVLVHCVIKNLATLLSSAFSSTAFS
jgi:hypothetical protein